MRNRCVSSDFVRAEITSILLSAGLGFENRQSPTDTDSVEIFRCFGDIDQPFRLDSVVEGMGPRCLGALGESICALTKAASRFPRLASSA